jgi:autotransporter-associated beta strand protein
VAGLDGAGQVTNSGQFNTILSVDVAGKSDKSTFTGVISSNQLFLNKAGAGTLVLSGNNTYGTAGATGTTVSDGTLTINNTAGSGTGPGGVLVQGPAKLDGSGTITGLVRAFDGRSPAWSEHSTGVRWVALSISTAASRSARAAGPG